MVKVSINLANGSIFEKPLITYFQGTNGNYIVLDNETNGSMGLPIICIGKVEGMTVNKIIDQTEWTSVKENLKTIISGVSLPYLKVPDTLSASDDFYTQLTLPIASFELLKSSYHVDEPLINNQPSPVINSIESNPINTNPINNFQPPINNVFSNPVPSSEPSPIDISPIQMSANDINPIQFTTSNISDTNPLFNTSSVSTEPQIPNIDLTTPVASPMESYNQVDIGISKPDIPITSTEPVMINNNENDIEAMKETFMKSCENMFDALVEKLKN